ncbi:hypothetical protein ACP275_14G011400 [Erythranthe tilingii]
MESDQNRVGSYGGEVTGSGGGGEKEWAVAKKGKNTRRWNLILRVAVVVLSLAAAVVLGFDKQTTTVALKLVPALPAVNVPVTAEWHHLSSFVYFVVVNSIVCVYGAISLLMILASGGRKKRFISATILVFDLTMVALLFSSIGAALAVGLIGLEGNSHLQWNKVCNVFGRFCRQGGVALGFSGAASLAFFLLVVLNHHKKT